MRLPFVLSVLLSAALFNSPIYSQNLQPQQQCAFTCVRREVRSLSRADRTTFMRAVIALMQNGQWDNYVQIHINAATYAHGNPNFLIWHRGYIREVERSLTANNRGACLHYWMWEMDSQGPGVASIWNGLEYGTPSGCQTQYLGGWQPSVPSRHCLMRELRGNRPLSSPESINFLISSSGAYDVLSQTLEVPHGTVHNAIGGDMGFMYSPNDPLFYLHHANVDYQYYRWQRLNPQLANTYPGDDNQQMLFIPYTPRALYDIRSLCYTYADFTGMTVSASKIHYCPIDIAVYNPNKTVLPDNLSRNISTTNNSAVLPDSLNRNPPPPGVLPDSLNRSPAPGVLPDNLARGPGPAPGPGAGPGVGSGPPTITFTLPPTPAPQEKPAEVAPTNLERNIPEVTVKPLPDNATRVPDGEFIIKLQDPEPLPESWCLMNNMNLTFVRQIEAKCRDVHSQLHKLYGYVSPSSLYLRRDLHARTIYRRDKGEVPNAQKKTCAVQVDTIGSVYVKYKENDPGKAHQEVHECLNKVLPKHYVKPESLKAKIQSIVGKDTSISQESVNNLFVTSKDGASGIRREDNSAATNAVEKGMVFATVLVSTLLILISS